MATAAPSYSSTLELELLSVLSTQPRRWVRLPFRAKVAYSRRPVEDVFESDTSRLFVTRRAPDAIDLSLQLDNGQLGREVMEQIEELRRMNVPVYVYPRWPGTTQYLWPLRRNANGDPANLTYTGTLANDDTTLYNVRASASRGVFLEAVGPSNPVILPGIYTGEHVENTFPLGQGVGVFAPRANLVKNSLFGDVTANVPANWTAPAGTPGTDMGVLTTSWIGTPALWLWGQHNRWVSASIALTAEKRIAVSFGWKCDGVLKVTLNYDAGTDEDILLGPGAGYYQAQHVAPATSATVTLAVVNSTGSTYGEFSAPQILAGNSDNDATPYFLGSSGLDTRGGLTSTRLRAASLDIEPHLAYSGGSYQGYGLTAISGYIQPAWEANFGASYGIAALTNSRTGKTIGCELSKSAGDLGMFFRVTQDGGVEMSSSVAHSRGDAYAFCLYCGQKSVSDAMVLGVKAAKVGTPGTIVTAETTSGIYRSTCFDGVRVGETDTDDACLDGIVGAYCIHSITHTDIATLLGAMASQDYTDLWRATMGKQYRILPNLSPSPWQRQYWGGAGTSPSIELTQYREL